MLTAHWGLTIHAHPPKVFSCIEFLFLLYCTLICELQNMYEEGDDEMKRTIAKAWTDARSGKAADPLKGGYP